MNLKLLVSSCLNRHRVTRPITVHWRCSLAFHRRLSSTFAPPDITPKTKPKSSTALRRSQAASASETIRKTSTPTRSDILPVITLATAERYALSQLKGNLPASARVLHEAWHVPRWGEQRPGEIFIFANGSFVCWGLTQTDARRFASQYLSNRQVEVGHVHEPETEELEFVTDPEEQSRLQGDLIILGQTLSGITTSSEHTTLPSESLMARYAFSQALSRSTALSVLEVQLDSYLSSVSQLPLSLSQTGKPGLSRTEVIKRLGEVLRFRQNLILNPQNFSDTPDLYWAEPVLEGLFNSINDALEVKQRTIAVNDKITYAAEVQSVLRQLLTESSGHRMELIIIVLIAVEVVLAFVREGPELWEILTDSGSSSSKNLSTA